ncbi:MAG: protein kinase [Bdellovibrionales bacterium]|nr:protein kinase [Bdellovibrionales bacterium]
MNQPQDEKLPIQVGPYTLVYKLGEGGLANVFLGLKNQQGYAVKMLKKDRLDNQKSIQNFIREARIGSNIKHPSFSKVVDHGKVGDYHFLVMELVYGINVFDMIQYFQSYGKKIPLSITLYILKGACEALRYLHDKTVFQYSDTKLYHGDLSPSNLMINQAGFFKLMDLGSSNQESTIKITKNHFGKLQFLPPEFFLGVSPNQMFDVYAMAIIAYQMIHGDLPFKAISKSDLVEIIKNDPVPLPDDPELTPNEEQEKVLKRFFIKALHKDPAKRHANIKEFEKDLFLIKFNENAISSFHEASMFLKKHFQSQLKQIDQTWNDQINFFSKYHQEHTKSNAQVESLILPSDRRKHPRILIDEDQNAFIDVIYQKEQLRFDIVQLGRGGLLAKWDQENAPQEGELIELKLDFGEEDRFKVRAEVRYTIKQKRFHFVGFEFTEISEKRVKFLDELVAEKQFLEDEQKEKLYHAEGMRNLHIYYPSKEVLHNELNENIAHKRAVVFSNTEFEHNSKVQLHLHALGTFQSAAFLGTVVMCSRLGENKYQLGLQLELHKETFDYLLELSKK